MVFQAFQPVLSLPGLQMECTLNFALQKKLFVLTSFFKLQRILLVGIAAVGVVMGYLRLTTEKG